MELAGGAWPADVAWTSQLDDGDARRRLRERFYGPIDWLPFAEAVRVQQRLFTTKPIFLGVEESLRQPHTPCGLGTDAERARAADVIAASPDKPPHLTLLEKGFLKEDALMPVLAEQFGLDWVDLTRATVSTCSRRSAASRSPAWRA